METTDLFATALNLDAPWQVVKVEFLEADDGRMELHLTIDFGKGEVFACPCDGCRHAATAMEFPLCSAGRGPRQPDHHRAICYLTERRT